MAISRFPIDRYLTPAEPPAFGERVEIVDQPILNGLPHRIELGSVATAMLIAPSGLAVDWRDADPTVRISSSESQAVPNDVAMADVDLISPPARLLVRTASGVMMGAIPLVAGRAFHLSTGESGAAIEVIVASWDLRAGNLRGPGDFGGRIRLGWQRADQAVSTYGPLPPHPRLLLRTPRLWLYRDLLETTAHIAGLERIKELNLMVSEPARAIQLTRIDSIRRIR